MFRGCVGLLRWKSLAGAGSPKKSLTSIILSLQPLSTCASTSREANQPLKQWTLVIDPFSKVRIQLWCNISVRPLDPHNFPESNRAFITVHGTRTDQGVKLDDIHVHYDDRNKELLVRAQKINSSVSVELTVPVSSDLDIVAQGGGRVQVQKMECDMCKVQTDTGSCLLNSVKAHQVQVHSHGGVVTGEGTLHGNVDISTSGDGAVDIKKVQGSVLKVSTEHGPLNVKALYASESISVASTSGSIQLGHVHGDCTVKTVAGNITVDGSSGHLQVSSHSGDVNVYVGESASADLSSHEGSVCVRVPSSIRASLELSGAAVEVSPEVRLEEPETSSDQRQTTITGQVNAPPQEGCWIKAQAARGSITLKTQSWFQSLKLGS